jgi:hypothetical protein
MKWKGLWPNEGSMSVFGCRDWMKPPKTSIKINGVPSGIRTEHLQKSIKALSLEQLVPCGVFREYLSDYWHLKNVSAPFELVSF